MIMIWYVYDSVSVYVYAYVYEYVCVYGYYVVLRSTT